MSKLWTALLIEAPSLDDPQDADEHVAALLDDYSPLAIEDLAERPLPPGGLWDPTFPPIPEPPPTPLRWRVFFSDADVRSAAVAALQAAWPSLQLSAVDVPDDDWAARSQASLTAVSAGAFVVAPPWDLPATVEPGQQVIVIEPSMGFGTGHHATTRLCLRLLSNVPLNGVRVLDIGTGSGVLAMAAALKGARDVVGIDVDQDAIDSARTSAALNTLPPVVTFQVADFRTAGFDAADVVLANLTGGMLRTTADALHALVRPGGTLILSGFDESEEPAVRAAFARLTQVERLEEATWVALRLT
ncbi:MAG: 50S ribosomal protein L11 methyltransferase, partial [Acidobacteria bacterium]|nr:50S ribosomal protein L11 methyltransferase [Acidobacteriota bacterium]